MVRPRPLDHVVLVAAVAAALAIIPRGEYPAARAEEASNAQALLLQARAAYAQRYKAPQDALAVELYEKAIALDASYPALWEGARACSHLGQNAWSKASRQKRQDLYRQGRTWAEQATTVNPRGAEGFFYLAVLAGLDAQERTFLHQMGQARNIRRAAERALKIDPSVECGGPPRLLGLYYRHLPTAFGGDNNQAQKFMKQALRHCPNDPELHYALAECMHTLGNDTGARVQAQWVLDHPPTDPNDRRSYREVKRETLELMQELD